MRHLPILSLKGGTGKTTTCISIAHELKRRGNRVGILDVDIHASALPRALSMVKDPGYESIIGGKLRPVMFDGFQVFSVGLLFPEDVPNMWDGEMKSEAVKQISTTSIAWDEKMDWVIVDTPPTSGDEVQSLLSNLKDIYGAVIICQPNDLSVLGIAKTLNVLRETETPIAGIVANMVGYRCPHCGKISNPFDRTAEDIQALARKFGVSYLGDIPFGGAEDRSQAIKPIVDNLLAWKPVTLKEKRGGLTKWLLKATLK